MLTSAFEFLVSGDTTHLRCSRRSGEAEVDLLFESVHFGDLDFDVIAQADDATGAAANEVIARRFENK